MGIKGKDAVQQEVVFKKGPLYSVEPTIFTLFFCSTRLVWPVPIWKMHTIDD